ncbi:GNAT family N-acetyltransferase [Dysgonomonas sp. ZJ279]|uniref:GNAT family N-acetyltransferase n=1 Tax=Dysgonomonas sp. ZJ279 TaxID=2709796 RepID=UPI0013ECDA1B|nr:GNAT family N-acetyltransferase [Dysgonomonas sp. ZJ279]
MKFEPIHIELKNGKTVTIREASVSDAEELIVTIREYVEESEFIPYIEGEFNPTIEDEKNWIQSFINQENSLLLLALCDNSIIGNISLNGSQRAMMKHTAGIGIGLLSEWRNQGVGSALFEAMISWAKISELELLWLETYNTNKIGLATYKKYGFEEVGKQKDFIKIASGVYADNVIMTLKIKRHEV